MPKASRLVLLSWSIPTNVIMAFGLGLIGLIDLLLLNSPQTPYRAALFVSLIVVLALLILLGRRMSEGCKEIHQPLMPFRLPRS